MNYEEAIEKEDWKKAMVVEMPLRKMEHGIWLTYQTKSLWRFTRRGLCNTARGIHKGRQRNKGIQARQTLYGLKQTYLRRPYQKKSSVLDICNFESRGSVKIKYSN